MKWRATLPIETVRLWLRELTPEDAQFAYDLNLNPEVIKYTGDPPFESVEEAKKFLEAYDHYDQFGWGRWGVIDKETDQLIGWCGLKQDGEDVDLGFRFFEKDWGKGYATEAGIACIFWAWANTEIERIIGRVERQNKGSIRVLEKLGMTHIGTTECGGFEDALLYEIKK